MLSRDVVERIVARVPLWTAWTMQMAHPSFAEPVHNVVMQTVAASMRRPCPDILAALLDDRQATDQPNQGMKVLHRTGTLENRFTCVEFSHDGVKVILGYSMAVQAACIRLVTDDAHLPTFDTAEAVLAAMAWFARTIAARGVTACTIKTRKDVHSPRVEVLNMLAHSFTARVLKPLLHGSQPS